jgi:hypothetical protein
LLQYTYVASRAIYFGCAWFSAIIVTAPPALATLAIVPFPTSLQNTRVASTAMSLGDERPVAIQTLA